MKHKLLKITRALMHWIMLQLCNYNSGFSNGELNRRKETQRDKLDAATSMFLKKKKTIDPSSMLNLLITTRDREARFPFLLEKCVALAILLCHCHYLKSKYSYAY